MKEIEDWKLGQRRHGKAERHTALTMSMEGIIRQEYGRPVRISAKRK